MFRTLDISTSGLVAQRQRMNTIAGNIANINTTRDDKGNISPFQRRFVTFAADTDNKDALTLGQGVTFDVVVDRESDTRRVFNPGHPDADAEGNVRYPNINLTTEFVNAVEASRAYEANVAATDMTKTIIQQTLKILA